MFQHGFPGLPHAMQQQMPHRTPNMQDNIPAVLSIMEFIYDNIMYAELYTPTILPCAVFPLL